jgi:segregation and condensation protein B
METAMNTAEAMDDVLEADEEQEAAEAAAAPRADRATISAELAEKLQDEAEQRRLVEALLFASAEPVPMALLRDRLPESADLGAILSDLQALYTGRGVELVRRGDAWAFRTAGDLAAAMTKEVDQPRKLSRATVETLAIIAYHQPVTRGEIETIRGVAVSRGVLDTLLELGWVKPGRRRESPGRPVTWVTTPEFLDHFGLVNTNDLPGLDELKAAGLLDARPAVAALADQWAEQGIAAEEQEEEEDDSEDDADDLVDEDRGEDWPADDSDDDI